MNSMKSMKMECYSVIKQNEIMPFPAILMDLEIVTVSKVSQRKIS